ncbi:pentatricopeptide repeat-containing protein mitochondrial-like [Dorcoceras hygrometricum]|uniref:Pentatricopeptide repeat-containing protein mitochondrial-like n=1 Tax=Dorcoceras hygrometricum TaxID=472368 RepID=A0A2Z7BCM4_9LAMI|nr:pentatricopeptide repeat-containing protein mitochondrial-like [Dorcoceras hygrometricum]
MTGSMHKVQDILSEMKDSGFLPNATTYDILVSCHGKIGNTKESVRLYCEMITKSFIPRTSTYNLLINNFSKAGKMKQAMELMNEMQIRGVLPNSSTYDILITGWCELSYLENSVKKSCQAEARRLFKEMSDKFLTPSESTIYHLSTVLAKPGRVADAQRVLNKLYKTR